MKQRFAFIALLFSIVSVSAQTETKSNNFLNELVSYKSNEGTVRIVQDSRLPQAIADRQTHTDDTEIPYITISGYRVQAYSSNVPKTARSEAFSMEASIKEKMPDATSYVSFNSPFWKVRIGDCRTYQEAMTLLNQLRKTFPEYKNNFYIVKEDNIRIPIK